MSRRSLIQKKIHPVALWKSVRRIQNFSLTPEIQTFFFAFCYTVSASELCHCCQQISIMHLYRVRVS